MKKAVFAFALLATVALAVTTVLAVVGKRREQEREREQAKRHEATLRDLALIKEQIEALGATTFEYPAPTTGLPDDDDGFVRLGPMLDGHWSVDDGWGRHLVYRRPGPVHKDGWDVFSLGPDGKGTDETLYVGASYVPDPRSARVDDVYGRETRERLEELHAVVARLEEKPESQDLGVLLAALKARGLESKRARFMDLWGHRLRWACPGVVHKKGWDLYSLGPNGEDEQGSGDDIVTGEDTR
jgi:hypothetical protein